MFSTLKGIARCGLRGFAAGAGTALYVVGILEGACLVLKGVNYIKKKVSVEKDKTETKEEKIDGITFRFK